MLSEIFYFEINRWRIESVNKSTLESENNEFEDIVKYCVNVFEYWNEYEKFTYNLTNVSIVLI